MENLKYPIGQFQKPEKITVKDLGIWIKDIQNLPNDLKKTVSKLSDAQLDTPYRPDGWTVRQVIHHLADSHINAYTRFKLAMTEENPSIKPYEEALWAELEDGKNAPIALSITLLTVLHKRWVIFLKSVDKKTWAKKSYFHPESKKTSPLSEIIGLYSWHGRHHLAQIKALIERENW
jgi:uncharacterized damage-inducible protein DinB